MGLIKTTDFNLYAGKPLDNNDWDTLISNIVNALTDGTKSINVDEITANTYNDLPGFTITGSLAGEALTQNDIVRLASDGKIYKATNATVAGITNILGGIESDYAADAAVTVNIFRISTFTTLTKGTVYYLSGSGGITSTKPSLNPIKIGLASSTTELILNNFYGQSGNVIENIGFSVTGTTGGVTINTIAIADNNGIEIDVFASGLKGADISQFGAKWSIYRTTGACTITKIDDYTDGGDEGCYLDVETSGNNVVIKSYTDAGTWASAGTITIRASSTITIS